MPFGEVCPYWSPSDTQLSPVAPSECLHATTATPWETASADRLIQVRVSARFVTLVTLGESETGLVYLCMSRLNPADCAQETTILGQRTGSQTQGEVFCPCITIG